MSVYGTLLLFLGPRGPPVLHLIGVPARLCARFSSPPSPPSPPPPPQDICLSSPDTPLTPPQSRGPF